MKNTPILCAIAAFLLMTGVITAAAEYEEEITNEQTGPSGPLKMQRIMNQVRDILGVCQGGCLLEELSGIMTYDDTNFFIGDVELHFGPTGYIASANAAVDYDGDGELETVMEELLGLVDTEVTVEGHYQSEDWMSVFTINGEVYREPGQPIWAAQHHFRWRNGRQYNQPQP